MRFANTWRLHSPQRVNHSPSFLTQALVVLVCPQGGSLLHQPALSATDRQLLGVSGPRTAACWPRGRSHPGT